MPLPPGVLTAIGGGSILATLIFQVLVGRRVIRLGRNHLKIHKWIGYALIALGVVHGSVALYFFVL